MTPQVHPGEASHRDIDVAGPGAPGPTTESTQPFDVLASQVDAVRDALDELNYRSTVLALHAASDDRSHLDLLSDEMTSSLARFRIAAERAIDTSRRVSTAYNLPSDSQTLVGLVSRSPDDRRQELVEQLIELDSLVAKTRDRLARAGGVVSSNHLLVMRTLDSLIGAGKDKVTYSEPVGSSPRLLDHRA